MCVPKERPCACLCQLLSPTSSPGRTPAPLMRSDATFYCFCPRSHVLPHLERFLGLCLSCMEVPRLTEDNMPSANNAIWSMGEMIIRVSVVPHAYCQGHNPNTDRHIPVQLHQSINELHGVDPGGLSVGGIPKAVFFLRIS